LRPEPLETETADRTGDPNTAQTLKAQRTGELAQILVSKRESVGKTPATERRDDERSIPIGGRNTKGSGSMTDATTGKTRRTDLFAGVPRGVAARAGKTLQLEDQAMPLAAFMTRDAIRASRQLAAGPDKLFLGVIDAEMSRRGGEVHALDGHAVGIGDDRHAMTIAGSRAGKGRSVVNPTLLSYQGSVLATDPKGELASITARHRATRLNQAVVVLDPFHVVRGGAARFRAGFNPMAILSDDSPTLIEDAGLIADALVVREESGSKDPHWDESARGFIEAVILHVATAPEHAHRRHLATVRDLIAGNKEVSKRRRPRSAGG